MTSDQALIESLRKELGGRYHSPRSEAHRALDTLARRLEEKGRQTELLLQVELERDETLTRLRELEDGLRAIAEETTEWLRNNPHSPHAAQCSRIARQLLSPRERTEE